MPELVDSHCHLDLCGDPDETVAAAAAQGVSRILAVGFDLQTSQNAVALAKKHPGVSASVGIHPNDARTAAGNAMTEIAVLAREPEVIAIGETGLDFYHDRAPREVQLEVFHRHIELARETGLTLMVHTREAQQETLDVLKQHAAGLRTVLHCFSLYEQLDECANRGYFMSIAGNVTYSKAAELKVAAAAIPAGLLLSETDAPWLTPVPHRGKPNSPANTPLILAELAQIRQTPQEELSAQILRNFQTAFPSRG